MNYTEKMEKAIEATERDFAKIRAGKATPALLDNVMIDYYGTPTPIPHVAKVAAPEPRILLITPWEKGMAEMIYKAIMGANMGLTPIIEGSGVRISMPILTSERRQELAKVVRKAAEEGRVAIRNIRREANDAMKKDNKDLPEDEQKKLTEEVQKTTDRFIAKIDALSKVKEEDILKV